MREFHDDTMPVFWSELSQQDRSILGTLQTAFDDHLLTDAGHGKDQNIVGPGEVPDKLGFRYAIEQKHCVVNRVHASGPSRLRNEAQTILRGGNDLGGYVHMEAVVVPGSRFQVPTSS